MANVSFRMDDELKRDAEALFNEIGITASAAYTMFAKACLRNNGLPFELVSLDPFYSAQNQRILAESIKQAESGKFAASKTLEELQAMENQ